MAHQKLILGNLMECQKNSIENITTSVINFAPTLINSYTLPYLKFSGNCLINKIPDSGKVINIYII